MLVLETSYYSAVEGGAWLVDAWKRLAEARIREWLRKPASERLAGNPWEGAVVPLELQLLEEVVRMHEAAASAEDRGEANTLRQQAAALETRLLVVLENAGRPLAAQHFAALLQEIRNGAAVPGGAMRHRRGRG